MVVIRLSRGGTNKRPFYKILAADRRRASGGLYLERLGYFNPIASGCEKRLELDRERLNYWLSSGAQPSERVKSLLRELDNPALVEKRKVKNAARKVRQKAKAKIKAEAEAVTDTKKEAEATEKKANEESK